MKKSSFIYRFKDKDITVHVTFSYQRNIYYRYREDGFYVTAPYLTRQKHIMYGLDKFGEKLINQFEKTHSNLSLEEGTFYLLGEKVGLNTFNLKNNEDLQGFLRKIATEKITKIVRKNEEIMGISLPHKISIKNTERQYGSNSKKTNRLSFQLDLIHYSEEIIESVVIHELAHDFERNHGKNFYNIVYSYCPNYKELQRKLKKGIHK